MKTIVFDFDGTLVDSGPGILLTLSKMIEELKLRPLSDEEMRSAIGPPISTYFPKLFDLRGEEELFAAISAYRRIFDEVAMPTLASFHGIPALLNDLTKEGYGLCIATCKTLPVCIEQAEALDIRKFFSHIHGVEPEKNLFSKADIMQAALTAANAEKTNAIMVGDSLHDVEGAQAVGIPCIGVTYGAGTEEELLSRGAMALAHSVEELRALLFAL